MKIEIKINSTTQSIFVLADTDQNILMVNNKNYNINISNFVDKILDIVLLWSPVATAPIVATDVETCKVNIETVEKTFNYYYCGDFPASYSELKNIIMEVSNE